MAELLVVVIAAEGAWLAVRGPVNVRLESNPPAASAYVDGAYVGQTPATVDGLGPGPHLVVFERRGFAPSRGVLHVDRLVPAFLDRLRARILRRRVVYSADLKQSASAVLVVGSTPDGAEVFLDGRLVGTTPLRLEGVEPGVHMVRLLKTDYAPAEAEVVLGEGGASVDLALASLKLGALERRIREHPENLHNYVDYAHLLVVSGKPSEAAGVLREGFTVLKEGLVRVNADEDQKPEARLYAECDKIYRLQYKYPAAGGKELRAAVLEMMRQAHQANPGDRNASGTLDRMLKHGETQ